MLDFFPKIDPYEIIWVPTDDDEYVLECNLYGNPNGLPIVYLHGGPAGGIDPNYARVYDPQKFKIIVYAQRGAGRSHKKGEEHMQVRAMHETKLRRFESIPRDLHIRDVETVRRFVLGEDTRWHVTGGSWGATLALLYAIEYPTSYQSLVLRGVCLGDQKHFYHFLEQASVRNPHFFEDLTNTYEETAHIKPGELTPQAYELLVQVFHEQAITHDYHIALKASRAWGAFELLNCSLGEPPAAIKQMTVSQNPEDISFLIDYGRGLLDLQRHHTFDDALILDNLHALRDKPLRIVHGKYDLPCNPQMAIDLHECARDFGVQAHLDLIESGHGNTEAGIKDGMIRAMAHCV